jgi:phosphatidylinositol-3-phosphatase
MRSLKTILISTLGLGTLLAASGCQLNASNAGVPGSPAVTHPDIQGTVFTIVFENKEQSEILRREVPTFFSLAEKYATADAYITDIHPSLPNYIMMTSGSTQGIGDSNGPDQNATDDPNNLGEQLDAAGVSWRAYMEDMGEPCRLTSVREYVVNHNPFVYYTSLTDDKERCKDRVVDFEKSFDDDLASGEYQYMWITPNQCNNMHNCDPSIGDAWLKKVTKKIMDSPGYKNGGALFIMFDEGSVRILGAEANLATIVIAPNLVAKGYATDTRFDHRSYLATIEDMFGMPRLATTKDATPMSEFFVEKQVSP